MLQPDSIRRRQASTAACRLCRGEGSSHLQDAVQLLEQGLGGLGLLVTECELLPEQRFDIYLVHLGIAIEVDGVQHFEGSYYGTPAALQFARDRKEDAMCLEAGQKLVRLHYLDKASWGATVLAALCSQCIITYSPSYSRGSTTS